MATLYFFNTVAAADTDWYTLENWWTDVGLTTQASSLPSSADNVFLLSIPSNTGSEPTVNSLTADAPLVFLVFPVTVTTTATFNYTSENRSTITGDAIFNTSSVNYGGTVMGDATFNNNSYADAVSTISGNVTLNDNGLILAATVTGNATFNNSEITNILAAAFSNIDGTITFNNPIVFTFSGEGTNWDGSSNTWIFNDTHEWVFNSGASNLGYINGNATFYNNSRNFNLQSRDATVDGDAVFNDSSWNGDTIIGNATFNNSAKNGDGDLGYIGTVQGNTTFNNSSHNNGSITGNATFNDNASNGLYPDPTLIYGGIVNGDAYFNDSSYNYLSTVDSIAYFSPSAAEVTLRYNCGTLSPEFFRINPEIIYQKGINGSSILGLL
jgi:hypothetical protein